LNASAAIRRPGQRKQERATARPTPGRYECNVAVALARVEAEWAIAFEQSNHATGA